MYAIGFGGKSTYGANYDDDFDKELFFEETAENENSDQIKEEIAEEISKMDDPSEYGNYKWDDFNKQFNIDKQTGDFTASIYIGWCLIAPTIKTRKLNNIKGDRYNHIQDLKQEAYLIIAKNIENYDPKKAQFQTYIDKFLIGASRELENPGISDYQARKKNVRLYSYEKLTDPSQHENDNFSAREFADEHSSIEDVIDRKERERSSKLFEQMMIQADINESSGKEDVYTNVVFLHKFLGGVNNLPYYVKEEIEASLGL